MTSPDTTDRFEVKVVGLRKTYRYGIYRKYYPVVFIVALALPVIFTNTLFNAPFHTSLIWVSFHGTALILLGRALNRSLATTYRHLRTLVDQELSDRGLSPAAPMRFNGPIHDFVFTSKSGDYHEWRFLQDGDTMRAHRIL
jgi:hypothetical protein